jgi:hypothetical protein
MIIDTNLQFSNAQVLTVAAASTNTIDQGATGTPYTPYGVTPAPLVRDVGRGKQNLDIFVDVVTTFAGLTTLQVQVQVSNDNATWTTIESGATVPAASLVAGYQFKTPFEIPEGDNQRYIRLYYNVTGTATAGAITAGMVASRQTNLSWGGQ